MAGGITLVLGGARSGKSGFAQGLAGGMGQKVLFVATAAPLDEEMRQRIEHHRSSRPSGWQTIEAQTGVAEAIERNLSAADVVLLDCLSLLAANLMGSVHDLDELGTVEYDAVEQKLNVELEGLVALAVKIPIIIVSNEVGMGLVPVYPAGRAYRDLLGRANQFIAGHAERVYLLTAGIPLQLKGEETDAR